MGSKLKWLPWEKFPHNQEGGGGDRPEDPYIDWEKDLAEGSFNIAPASRSYFKAGIPFPSDVSWPFSQPGDGDFELLDAARHSRGEDNKKSDDLTFGSLFKSNLKAVFDEDQVKISSLEQIIHNSNEAVSKLPIGEVPFPEGAKNSAFDPSNPGSYVDWSNYPAAESLPTVQDIKIIAGVIDRGIPLSHYRTRKGAKKTRILCAWNQGACYDNSEIPPIPCGNEVYAEDIDKLLTETDTYGEEEVNSQLGSLDRRKVWGDRGQMRRASHGAHVLDTVAGYDPESEEAGKIGIVAVNMPGNEILGPGGQFLELFALLGIKRIVDFADRLWVKNNPNSLEEPAPKGSEQRGYPIVINLSFSKLAGMRGAKEQVATFLKALNDARRNFGWAPVTLVVPAGNENLRRGNATALVRSRKPLKLDWQVSPADQSSNFVDIWCREGEKTPKIQVTTPSGVKSIVNMPKISARSTLMQTKQENGVTSSSPVARIYSIPVENGPHRFLICVKQTEVYSAAGGPGAPAGTWEIKVMARGRDELKVHANVQTDGTGSPAKLHRQSYFDGGNYQEYEGRNERVADTFAYDRDNRKSKGELDSAEGVRRRGSLNAVGFGRNDIRSAGGYIYLDGRPAPYSASGIKDERARGAPSAALPTEDGYGHRGYLAAGSRDGSTAHLSGTSSGSAQLARMIIEKLCGDFQANGGVGASIDGAIKDNATAPGEGIGTGLIAKIGNARLKKREVTKVPRMETYD